MSTSRTFHRRQWMQGATAFGFGSLLASHFNRAWTSSENPARFRRCVVLWMEGGPSQLDTFDPKRSSTRKSIATNVTGLKFAETLPGLAARADELCVVRSVGSREGEHGRATELMHTGFAPVPSFPRPALGSIFSHQVANGRSAIPNYVTLGGSGYGPAFLGTKNAAFVIENMEQAKRQLDQVARKQAALDLLSNFNESYARTNSSAKASQRSASIESVRRLLDTSFSKALELDNVSTFDRNRYGDHRFGQRVLAARQLLKSGVPFVEVQLSGWDTHVSNQRRTNELCQLLEQPWLALMDDLQRNHLWDDTLIVWMGEFGRTPTINGRAGRDHFPEATPVVMAGGGLGGKVVGQTSDNGAKREGDTHTVGDLMATVLTLLGIDIHQEFTTSFGSPTTVTDNGTPIPTLVS